MSPAIVFACPAQSVNVEYVDNGGFGFGFVVSVWGDVGVPSAASYVDVA